MTGDPILVGILLIVAAISLWGMLALSHLIHFAVYDTDRPKVLAAYVLLFIFAIMVGVSVSQIYHQFGGVL